MSSFNRKYAPQLILPLSNLIITNKFNCNTTTTTTTINNFFQCFLRVLLNRPFVKIYSLCAIFILFISPVIAYLSYPGGFKSNWILILIKIGICFSCIYLGILTSMCFELEIFNKNEYLTLIPWTLLFFTFWFIINCIVIFTHSTYDLATQETLLKDAKTTFESIAGVSTNTGTKTTNTIDDLKKKLDDLEKELNGVSTASLSITQDIDSIISEIKKLKKDVLKILQTQIDNYKKELDNSNLTQTNQISTNIQTLENNIDKINEIDFRNLDKYKNNNKWKNITRWTFWIFVGIVVILVLCDILTLVFKV